MLWPGHNFLGPGNDAFRPEAPVDSDDAIAQRHDIAYASARTKQDIWKADREAFFEFSKDALHGSWHSAIAAPIIGGKYLLETTLDTTLYPRNMPVGKREPDEHPSGGKRAKPTEDGGAASAQPLPDSQGITQTGQDGANPQAGSSMPGGTGASVASTIIRNPSSGMHTIKFNKTFQLYTGGFQFRWLTQAQVKSMHQRIGRQFAPSTKFLLTPLATLNPDYKGLFMSNLEWITMTNMLAFASECRIRVKPLGYRLPFATNEAASGFANSQTLVQIGYTVGLNTQYNFIETGYGTAAGDLTLPTTFTDFNHYASLYGDSDSVGCNVGIPRHWNNYSVLAVPNNTSGANIGTPALLNQMCIENVNDTKGMPVIEYTYQYKNGLINIPTGLFSMRDAFGPDRANPNVNFDTGVVEGFTDTATSSWTAPNNTPQPSTGYLESKGGIKDISSNDLSYQTRIELSHLFQRNAGRQQTPDRPPMLHFGCLPVQSNAALASTATFANAVVQWVVETELICHYQHDYLLPDDDRLFVNEAWDAVMNTTYGNMSWDASVFTSVRQYDPPCAYIANRISSYTPITPVPPGETRTMPQFTAESMSLRSPSPSYQNYKALMEEEKRKARKEFPQPNTHTA